MDITYPQALAAPPARATAPVPPPLSSRQKRALVASSLGTAFEWYDFYLYGAMAALLAQRFFSGVDAGTGFVLALLTLAAGFIVRPAGALLFGRMGDLVGRKYTFIVTLVTMGLATFMIGLLPGYDAVGVAAPVLLVVLRLMQGLALGGEYGGAAAYAAEHAPAGRRGFYTAWLQATAALGLLLALLVVLGTRSVLGEAAFEHWGWRLPFLLSAVLLVAGAWLRRSMLESPAFRRVAEQGRLAQAPLAESLGRWRHLRLMLLALFGLVAGQAVVWYTGHFHVLLHLEQRLHLDAGTTAGLMTAALLLTLPMLLAAGALSDRVGRKPVIAAGLLLACVSFFPVFKAMAWVAHPALAQAQASVPVLVMADPAGCSAQWLPANGDTGSGSACDLARRTLARFDASFRLQALPPRAEAQVLIDGRPVPVPQIATGAAGPQRDSESVREIRAFRHTVAAALADAGYPAGRPALPPFSAAWWQMVGLLALLGLAVALVYGPTAAMLAELFPTRIRYTAISLPYHVGNGWFGGLMPTLTLALATSRGDTLQGLWYPVGVAALCLLIGWWGLPETRGRDLEAGEGMPASA
ncbi:MFS transporter [Pseudorhodoferax sp.]|uniref:MFS transporter n=1 Tax=Pseudorhodoferax sp. TaxID=1993553 RepID=UPI002DD64EED|nr:MFS transporter [Pseudorhodoferax sp.]